MRTAASVPAMLEEWSASADQSSVPWLEVLGWVGAGALAALWVFALVRAVLRHARYRAVEALTEADREAVHEAIRRAERRSVGEILPVVVERSDPHPGARWIAALVSLGLGSVLLAGELPWGSPGALLACQAGMGLIGWLGARFLPDFERRFLSEARATRVSAEQAFQEFYRHGLQHTEAQTGVLLFVSLLERRVVVLADEGIDARVRTEDWERTDRAILEGVRRGDLAGGLVDGIECAAELLEEHFPWTEGDRNELPDRLVVRAE